ncbi:hypothetical protein ARMSODRAFT_983149 [Armillaria solidipes]|uniref:F-box domain-containing protein n=1 Tax=Armillaria solidipes TaxID=1076256 RepID=A0A2H3AJZ8_9AGAR|nr:hypothetical protein ARMSODRAFT_983149 [Armillaria solidipes]
MANSDISQYTQFPIQKLPPELLAEILSYLTVTEIKPLSLTCTTLNNDCFPFVFRNPSLHRNHHRATKFIVDFKDRTPAVPCLRKLTLNELNEDISKEILPWSTLIRNAKIDGGHLGNLTVLPSLKLLHVLELVNIAVQSRRDYFEILSTIPLSVKDLRLRNNTFLDNSPLPHPVTCKIEVERLHIDLGTDLSLRLEDDCPISFGSLRAASIVYPEPQDLRNLVQRSPGLVDLTIFMRGSGQEQTAPFQFPIRRLKHLNIIARSGEINILTEILLEEPSDTPHALETLSLTIPHCWMANPTRDWDNIASALAQHRFPSLSALNFKVVNWSGRIPPMRTYIFRKWMAGFKARNAGRLHINFVGLNRRAYLFVIEKAAYFNPTIARQNGRLLDVPHCIRDMVTASQGSQLPTQSYIPT